MGSVAGEEAAEDDCPEIDGLDGDTAGWNEFSSTARQLQRFSKWLPRTSRDSVTGSANGLRWSTRISGAIHWATKKKRKKKERKEKKKREREREPGAKTSARQKGTRASAFFSSPVLTWRSRATRQTSGEPGCSCMPSCNRQSRNGV